VFTPGNATIYASPWGSGVCMSVSNADHRFYAEITPPTGQALSPGTYATTEPASDSSAGMRVYGDGG
jgi:hypothetical protein